MSVVSAQTEKYKKIAEKHGLQLSDSDIMYLQAFVASISREEIARARKKYEDTSRK